MANSLNCALLLVLGVALGQSLDVDYGAVSRGFSSNLYKILARQDSGNFLICPQSVATIMALLSLGSKGATFTEICRGLGLPEDSTAIQNIYKELTPRLRGNEFYSLSSANRIFVNKDFQLNDTYQQIAESAFDAGVSNIDFDSVASTISYINKWVEDKTNNKIHDIVTADDITPNTELILGNTMYFKDGTSTDVNMMLMTDHFNYYENKELDCKFIQLPYEGGEIYMVIALPNEKTGIRKLEERIKDVLEVQPFQKQFVRVLLPKFTIESSIKMKSILEEMGIKKAFSTDADLSGIGRKNTKMFVNSVLQKTFINVTETGTEAAAATTGGVVTLSIPLPKDQVKIEFNADHPFIAYIDYTHLANVEKGRYLSSLLFAGRYTTAPKA